MSSVVPGFLVCHLDRGVAVEALGVSSISSTEATRRQAAH